MPTIDTVYLCNHTHTDIGFTDYQDVAFRQHAEFYGQALDLIEATDDYPEEARYRWTCETTGPLLRYLRGAPDREIERFLDAHRRGRIDIAAMQYNLTPLLDVEQMHRSLYPLAALRELGFSVEAAMQDDVNGVSWLFADLLPAVGVDFYTAAVNPIRGARPEPFPGAFWWEGPSGRRVLAWNGFHYLFGRSQARLGSWDFVDRFLPRWIEQLEADPDYPYDFLYCETTHPVRVDNGPPDARMPEFVKRWNEEGRTPRLAMTTVTAFGRMLRERHGDALGVQRGDWTDHWTDGPGSSAYETGLNRSTHELLYQTEALEAWLRALGDGSWDAERMAHVYEQATLYDEHTWGAYSSIEEPFSLFTKAQWNRKSGYAYAAAMEAHDVLARAANALADRTSERGPEGTFNLGDLTAEEAFPPSGASDLLVVNTLPWERRVLVEEPQARGRTAPVGMLDTFFNRHTGWGGDKPVTPMRRVEARLPPLGYAYVPLADEPAGDDLRAEGATLENAFYRVRLDPESGAVVEWFDKELEHDFAGDYRGFGLGQYLYETVDDPEGRLAIANIDFDHPDFFVGAHDTPWLRCGADEVTLGEARVANGRAEIEVSIRAAGVEGARCRVWLDSGARTLGIDWTLDKRHVTDPEAVFVALPFRLGGADFTLDLNGVPAVPNDDQLDGAAVDWYPVGRWLHVGDGERGVTVVPLDAPLVQLGGITSGRWARRLEPEGPTVMSWALNNHWLVNFKASQGGEIPLRYRLTTHGGPLDVGAAARFGAEAATVPLALRDRAPRPGAPRRGSFLSIPEGVPALLTAKPAADGRGVVLRVQNLDREPRTLPVTFAGEPAAAWATSPVEEDGERLPLAGRTLEVPLRGLEIRSLRVEMPPAG